MFAKNIIQSALFRANIPFLRGNLLCSDKHKVYLFLYKVLLGETSDDDVSNRVRTMRVKEKIWRFFFTRIGRTPLLTLKSRSGQFSFFNCFFPMEIFLIIKMDSFSCIGQITIQAIHFFSCEILCELYTQMH